jgi:hypothetical protein
MVKAKLFLQQGMEAHRFMGCWGSHNLDNRHTAVRLSALRAGRALPIPERFVLLISVRGGVKSKAIMRLEGLGNMENSMIL